jgi:hypothetical protein
MLFSAAGCGNFFGIKGEGPVIEESRTLLSFDGIKLEIPARLILQPGGANSLRIEAQENILAIIETKVVDNKLVIRFDNNVATHDGITVYASFPTLRELSISGSGSCLSEDTIQTVQLDLGISGSGNMDLHVVTNKVNARISGSGELHLMGNSVETIFDISGSGLVEAGELTSVTCKTTISGSGKCNVNVSETLDVDISGSGTLNYMGSPQINSHISGSGKVVNAN